MRTAILILALAFSSFAINPRTIFKSIIVVDTLIDSAFFAGSIVVNAAHRVVNGVPDSAKNAKRAVFADSSTNTHTADTSLAAKRSVFADSSTNTHKADTSLAAKRSVFADSSTNTHKADTSLAAKRSVFADSSTNTHKADTSLAAKRSVFTDSTLKIPNIVTAGGPVGTSKVTPVITYNAQGRLTTVSSATIIPDSSIAARTLHGGNACPDSLNVNGYTVIQKDGKVGIGTAIPMTALNIMSDAAYLRLSSISNGGGINAIQFSHAGNLFNYPKTAILTQVNSAFGYSASDIYFVLNNEQNGNPYNTSNDTRMIIKSSGNVGIGTTAPAFPLTIKGNGMDSGSFTVTGTTSTDSSYARAGKTDRLIVGDPLASSLCKITIPAQITTSSNYATGSVFDLHKSGNPAVDNAKMSFSLKNNSDAVRTDSLWLIGPDPFGKTFYVTATLGTKTSTVTIDSNGIIHGKIDSSFNTNNLRGGNCISDSLNNGGTVIQKDGKVGIGTANPSYQLSVSGMVGATGYTSNARDTFAFEDTTFYDSLYDNTTFRARILCRIIKMGKLITMYQGELHGTIGGTGCTIKGIPKKFTDASTIAIPRFIVEGLNNSNYVPVQVQYVNGILYVTKTDMNPLDAGDTSQGGVMNCMISWIMN